MPRFRTLPIPSLLIFVLVVAAATTSGAGATDGAAERLQHARSPVGRAAAVWPTDAPHVVLRPFAAPVTRYSAGHRGIDIAAAEGQPVYAIAAGTVSFAGAVVDRSLVSIAHGDGLVSSLEPVSPTVAAGDTVIAGQQIGVVALSPHCDLGCVHLGIRLDGAYVSPLLLLGTVPRAVLLPTGSG